MTSRRWCFTSFAEELAILEHDDGTLKDPLKYAVYQRESCPTTRRPHWQGYVELTRPQRKSGVQRLLGDPVASVRVAGGTREQNYTYCTKPDTRLDGPFVLGEDSSSGQGRRSDLESVVALVKSGGGLDELYERHGVAMVKYTRGISALLAHYRRPSTLRANPRHVYVHWGPTGSGKTRDVYDSTPLSELWRAPISVNSNQWFDGYVGQRVALFDDFDGRHPSITHMLQVTDRYPLDVPVKGGHVAWNPDVIYITTNIPFEEWYPDADASHRAALYRRITRFIHFDVLGRSEVVPPTPRAIRPISEQSPEPESI